MRSKKKSANKDKAIKKSSPCKTAIERLQKFKKVRDKNLKKLKDSKKLRSPSSRLRSESTKVVLKSDTMACQVEILNSNGSANVNDKDSSTEDESDIEISTLKQTLKKKLLSSDSVSDKSKVNVEVACSSSSVTNGTVENGHGEDKAYTDSELDNDSDIGKQTPKKTPKGKQVKERKGKSTTPNKSKRSTPAKSLPVEEPSFKSEQSWESIELAKDEEDTSIIDVVGDVSDSTAIENDFSLEEEQDVKTECSDEKSEAGGYSNMLTRLRNSMRFSVSPRKEENPSNNTQLPVHDDSRQNSFKGISGRRGLRRDYPEYGTNDVEHTMAKKRKADSEGPETPKRKYFGHSFSEHSPGWKFFSVPISQFWSPKKSPENSSMSSSTPLRKLHEDVEDSMSVNVNDSLNISLPDDDYEMFNDEKFKPVEGKSESKTNDDSVQASWKCIVM